MNKKYVEKINRIKERAFFYNDIIRKEGLLSLEGKLDEKGLRNKEVLEYGIILTIFGENEFFINSILTNLVNRESSKPLKLIKTIEKEIVIHINEGITNDHIDLLIDSIIEIDELIYMNYINKRYFNSIKQKESLDD